MAAKRDGEDLAKHLEMIQGVVERMARNSFLLKGWTVTLVAAIFALTARNSNPEFSLLAFLPALTFWGLDAYYLRQERLYRKLYEAVREAEGEGSRAPRPFSLNAERYEKEVGGWLRTLWSWTVLPLHGAVIAFALVAFLVANLAT